MRGTSVAQATLRTVYEMNSTELLEMNIPHIHASKVFQTTIADYYFRYVFYTVIIFPGKGPGGTAAKPACRGESSVAPRYDGQSRLSVVRSAADETKVA